AADAGVDVIAEVLDATHLSTAIFGRLELGAPWRLRVPGGDYLSFYIVARGGAWLELSKPEKRAARTRAGAEPAIALSAGDAVLLPRAVAHVLRDANRSDAPPLEFDYAGCPRVASGEAARLGGDGPVTSLIAGHFTLG